jgi:hypothetical protein
MDSRKLSAVRYVVSVYKSSTLEVVYSLLSVQVSHHH